ncbi:MAG: carboxypeptidase-like regulatory domain-containing protein [Candidatus Marinimicrobia bacterium]|nr:carboxypeptidase-like regulatory domain-containing protein [Candidatus Neomarinimicrobiota bacterium]MCF7828337.1 carboxypeptidase-like regulatory domain-containing protein [Candidatus Neomarinimicrobiota bacterium]MCF7879488.1 carboxypeptidase-like regulatory domain-containing protein [Candidatus Neomarinimicrobiota bacterium]
MKPKFRTFFTLTIVAVLLISCDTSPLATGDPSMVEGYVTDGDGNQGFSKPAAGIEGATVTLARIKTDGEIQTVSNAEVTTDAEGKFTLETDLENERHLVVIATKNSNEWRAIVSASVQNGNTVRCEPLTTESTVEAAVFEKFMAEYGEEMSKDRAALEIQNAVNARTASEVYLLQPSYVTLATAVRNRIDAKAQLLSANTGSGYPQAEMDSLRVQAQAQLETQLYNANGNASAIQSAYTAYNDAWMEVALDAGIQADHYTQAEQAGYWSLTQSSTSLTGNAEAALAHKAAVHKANAAAYAAAQLFDSLEVINGAAASNVTNVEGFGQTLKADIKSSTTLSGIEGAFQAFRDSLMAELAAAIDANVINVSAEDISAIDTEIRNNARVTLRNRIRSAVGLGGAINIDDVVGAYITFMSDVDARYRNVGVLQQNHAGVATSVTILAHILAD